MVDRNEVERWLKPGLSLREIARRLDIPWAMFRRHWQELQAEVSPPVHADITEMPPRPSPPAVDARPPAQRPPSPPWETERWTMHVDKRWIEAVKQEADAEGVPIMAIVDWAFSISRGGRHRSTTVDNREARRGDEDSLL